MNRNCKCCFRRVGCERIFIPIPKANSKERWQKFVGEIFISNSPSVKGYCMYKIIVKNAETRQRLTSIFMKRISRTYRDIARTFLRIVWECVLRNDGALIVVEASAKLIKPTGGSVIKSPSNQLARLMNIPNLFVLGAFHGRLGSIELCHLLQFPRLQQETISSAYTF